MSDEIKSVKCSVEGCTNQFEALCYYNQIENKYEIRDEANSRCSFHRKPKIIANWGSNSERNVQNGQQSLRDPDFKKLLSVIMTAQKYQDAYNDDLWLQNLLLHLTTKKSR